MAAPTIAFTILTGLNSNEFKEPVGSHNERVATLTMVCNASTYVDGGLADATNFKSGWFRGLLDFASVRYVEALGLGPLQTSDAESAFFFAVDVTNRKVLLYGTGGTSYTAGTIAVASTTSITDSANGFVTAGFKPGDMLAIDGFTGTIANNQVVRVTAVAANGNSLTVAIGGLAIDAAGETVTLTKIGNVGGVLSEIHTGAVLPDGTYTAKVRIYGDYP